MFKKLGEVGRLVRVEHALMLMAGTFIGSAVALGGMPPMGILLLFALLVPAFSEMGSFALNDYVDVEADRINKRGERPLVKGTLSPEFALRLSLFAFVISTLLALFINWAAFAIAVIFNVCAVLYNLKLKDLPALGNMYIAATMAIPFIFGAYAFGLEPSTTVWMIAALGFVSGLGREIVKTVEDVEGDREAREGKTLPMVVGERNALALASALFLAFIPLSIIPFVGGLGLSLLSGVFLAVADLGILWAALHIVISKSEGALGKARKYTLVFLGCGLMALLLAAFGM